MYLAYDPASTTGRIRRQMGRIVTCDLRRGDILPFQTPGESPAEADRLISSTPAEGNGATS